MYLHFSSRYGFPKLNATVPFLYKKRKYRQGFLKWTFLPAELETGTKGLQIDVFCKAIDQNFDWLQSLRNFAFGLTTYSLIPRPGYKAYYPKQIAEFSQLSAYITKSIAQRDVHTLVFS